MKSKVVDFERKSDKIFTVELVFEEKVINVISEHALLVGCEEKEKEKFWQIELYDTRNTRK
jgi:hypothetical protein